VLSLRLNRGKSQQLPHGFLLFGKLHGALLLAVCDDEREVVNVAARGTTEIGKYGNRAEK